MRIIISHVSTGRLWRPLFLMLMILPAIQRNTDAAAVTKMSWESKAQYNRFVLEFDGPVQYNAVNAIHDKSYFYVDVYGLTTTYRRRLLTIDDSCLRYVDAVSYPEHSVLRLVFYVKDPNADFRVVQTTTPPRLVIDSVANKSVELATPAGGSVSGSQVTALSPSQATAATPATNIEVAPSLSIPSIPEPGVKPFLGGGSGRKKTIIIDAGHGGANSGATSKALVGGKPVYEKDLTLQFAYYLKKLIDASPNMVALLTRSDDSNVSLDDRVHFAESNQGDFFISIHMNDGNGSADARGVEMYFLNEKGTVTGAEQAMVERENRDVGSPKASTKKGEKPILTTLLTDIRRDKLQTWQYESYLVCKKLQESFQGLPYFAEHNRGIKSNNFFVLKNFDMPAVLLEVGFITNTEDLRYLLTPQFQQATAALILNGLNNYFAENDPSFKPRIINLSSTPAAN